MRLSVLLLSPLLLTSVARAEAAPTRYLQLVNHAQASIVTVQVAAHGTAAFREMALETPLRGGGESQRVALRRVGCRYDLRFVFADGRTLRYEDVDLCRHGEVAVRALPRGTGEGDYRVELGRTGATLAERAADGAGRP